MNKPIAHHAQAAPNHGLQPLHAALHGLGDGLTIAVSGGVDSLTLATAAHRLLRGVRAVHATSPAVPAEATDRVRALAAAEGWALQVIDAGEFDDPAYRANPANRCLHCKTHLYGALRALTDGPIASGANLDDLAEYRPGLDAARQHGVRHPYVDAGIDKAGVRRIAATLGLGDVAELPSSPCLSSRIETGIAIDAPSLAFVHHAERLVASVLSPRTVRCRVRADGIVIELDRTALGTLVPALRDALAERLRALQPAALDATVPIRFAPYRNGSAFLIQPVAAAGTPVHAP